MAEEWTLEGLNAAFPLGVALITAKAGSAAAQLAMREAAERGERGEWGLAMVWFDPMPERAICAVGECERECQTADMAAVGYAGSLICQPCFNARFAPQE